MKAVWIAAWLMGALAVWTAGSGAHPTADADAFWAAASAASSLYSPLSRSSDEPAPTSWCEGDGQTRCEPAAPCAPHNGVSFADTSVAVITHLALPRSCSDATRVEFTQTTHPEEGVRVRVERPPQA